MTRAKEVAFDRGPCAQLWGAFPRVLGHFSRDLGLFPLHTAVHKMTGLSAARFGLAGRGEIREGHWADLVLFDPVRVRDVADFKDPQRAAEGIGGVWINGVLSYRDGQAPRPSWRLTAMAHGEFCG